MKIHADDCLELLYTFTGEDFTDCSWTNLIPIDGKLGVLDHADVHVFSNSAICLGKSSMADASKNEWKTRFFQESEITGLDWDSNELIESVWPVHPELMA